MSCQRSLRLTWGCNNGMCCHVFQLAVVVDVVAEFARGSALIELLYADALVMMSEVIECLRKKFIKWKEAYYEQGFES